MSKIIKGLKNPYRVPGFLYRKSHNALDSFNKYTLSKKYELVTQDRQKIIELSRSDWDNVIILDACRFDYFKKHNTIPGQLQSALSPGSESWAFMKHNFQEKIFHDTIYITANPHSVRLDSGIFFKVVQTLDNWDSELEVVHPETVTEATLKALDEHPNKKIIVHFMQPHTPWLGETAKRIRKRVSVYGNNKNHGLKKLGKNVDDPRDGEMRWFEAVEKGHISHKEMESAYGETLDIVLTYVERLVRKLNGKTIITSDHGEMLGERCGFSNYYGHPSDLSTKTLRKVPWFEVPYKERREISTGSPKEQETLAEDIIQDRLEALGYK